MLLKPEPQNAPFLRKYNFNSNVKKEIQETLINERIQYTAVLSKCFLYFKSTRKINKTYIIDHWTIDPLLYSHTPTIHKVNHSYSRYIYFWGLVDVRLVSNTLLGLFQLFIFSKYIHTYCKIQVFNFNNVIYCQQGQNHNIPRYP